MAMKKEALTNLIADDLAKRNDNWTEIDTTFELKADKATTYTKTEVDTSLATVSNLVPSMTGLQEEVSKNKYYPIIKDNTGTILGRNQTQLWNGTTYVASGGNFGFGTNSLQNNIGSYANGFGHYSLQNNIGSYANGFGTNSLQNNIGSYANGFGTNSLQNNTGSYSNGFGNNSLRYNTVANNTALGFNSFNAFIPNPAGTKSCEYTAIDTTLKRATVTAHGFGANGTYTLVNYSTTGTAIGGMSVGTVQIKIIDANTIEFVTGSVLQNITSQGTGTHTFTPSMNYSNTTSLGAYTQPNRNNQVVLGSTAVNSFRFGGTFRTPASSSDTGVVGEFCYDTNYLYLCTAVNTWKRVALGGETW